MRVSNTLVIQHSHAFAVGERKSRFRFTHSPFRCVSTSIVGTPETSTARCSRIDFCGMRASRRWRNANPSISEAAEGPNSPLLSRLATLGADLHWFPRYAFQAPQSLPKTAHHHRQRHVASNASPLTRSAQIRRRVFDYHQETATSLTYVARCHSISEEYVSIIELHSDTAREHGRDCLFSISGANQKRNGGTRSIGLRHGDLPAANDPSD